MVDDSIESTTSETGEQRILGKRKKRKTSPLQKVSRCEEYLHWFLGNSDRLLTTWASESLTLLTRARRGTRSFAGTHSTHLVTFCKDDISLLLLGPNILAEVGLMSGLFLQMRGHII